MTVLCASGDVDGLSNCVSMNFVISLIIGLYEVFIYATALLDHFPVTELVSSYSETHYSCII